MFEKMGIVSHDAALSPGDDEIKQCNLMVGELFMKMLI
jgi:hypothetical protein